MSIIDWMCIVCLLAVLFVTTFFTKRYVRSVADYLAANRCAGRYLLTVSTGVGAMGAITIIACFEGVFVGGLTNGWWSMADGLVVSLVMISGWILYRFRQTRALTLAQFLEMRYSRRFRIFAGFICWISGIINFGIFPAVGAQFFLAVLNIPMNTVWFGLSAYIWFLLFLIGISYLFALWGGQITVMVTDFLQGVFCNVMMVIIVIVSIGIIGIPTISKTLLDGISRANNSLLVQAIDFKLAGGELAQFDFQKSPKEEIITRSVLHGMAESTDRDAVIEKAQEFYRNNDSMIHPFKISGKKDLNIWFYLMAFWLNFYGGRIWQGSQGYNASARTPHEARMGNVLALLRTLPVTVFTIAMPICALAFYNSDAFVNHASELKMYIEQLGNPNIQRQMATPLAMMSFLPIGLKGGFVALMLAAFISTCDTYMHSWGSIFIQDVVLPLRKKPFTTNMHINLLKLSILFVCVFVFIFSLIFRQTEYIVMFWNITGAIFTGGAGAVVIGGLYWKRGTTGAAWSAMITGSVLSVGSIFLRQIHMSTPFTNPVLEFIASKNGMILAFWSGVIAVAVYAAVSLLAARGVFNMDKMLRRGKYAVADDSASVEEPVRGLKALIGVSPEFTRWDRVVYYFCIAWMLFWSVIFLIGTIYGSLFPTSDNLWLSYWKFQFSTFVMISIIVTVWFGLGGIRDLIAMFQRLNRGDRDEHDDGTVGN